MFFEILLSVGAGFFAGAVSVIILLSVIARVMAKAELEELEDFN